jgi:hypothetical protein
MLWGVRIQVGQGRMTNPYRPLSQRHAVILCAIKMHSCLGIRSVSIEMTEILVFLWTSLASAKYCAFLWVLCYMVWQAWDDAKFSGWSNKANSLDHCTLPSSTLLTYIHALRHDKNHSIDFSLHENLWCLHRLVAWTHPSIMVGCRDGRS